MSTVTARTIASAEVQNLSDLMRLFELAEQYEEPDCMYLYDALRREAIKAQLVETVLTDGSKVYDVVLDFGT